MGLDDLTVLLTIHRDPLQPQGYHSAGVVEPDTPALMISSAWPTSLKRPLCFLDVCHSRLVDLIHLSLGLFPSFLILLCPLDLALGIGEL
jgi:hypothetical protein